MMTEKLDFTENEKRADDASCTKSDGMCNGENNIKTIRIRNGHTVEIYDVSQGGFIRIYDNKKENYVLTFSIDEKTIKLESMENIELSARKNIVIDAGEDIIINARKDIELESNESIRIFADNKLEQKADGMKLDGGNEMEIIARQVKID